jgi:hypothetical protein
MSNDDTKGKFLQSRGQCRIHQSLLINPLTPPGGGTVQIAFFRGDSSL